MEKIKLKNRREFLKTIGIGVGTIMISPQLPRLFSKDMPPKADVNILDKFGLSKEQVKKILSTSLEKGGEFADIFFEYRISSSITLEEDIVKSTSENILFGLGVRVINGIQTGYAHTNDLRFEQILKTARTAGAIANDSTSKIKIANLDTILHNNRFYSLESNLTESEIDYKISLVRRAYDSAINMNYVSKVMASLSDEIQYVAIANSEGELVFDTRPQARMVVVATAEKNGVKNTGTANTGGRIGKNYFEEVVKPETIGEKAANEAITLLSAKNAPVGEQIVVLSKDQSGVMIHEAVGHPLEADKNWRKSSIMWDKFNQLVANDIVTIYDDATIDGYRGSLNIDDEGIPTENVMLIEKGKLIGYLNDRLSAKIMSHKLNGHGRRESYHHPPIPRMNNTILAQGDKDPQEIIESVKKGFYAVTYQGGMVNDTGKFTFSVNLGYMIENGKLTYPVKNATLIGTNVQILREVSMIGDDMGFFLGTCGKSGQSVPVTCGTPTLKIDKMTVGGVV